MSAAPLQLDFRREPRSAWAWVGWGMLALSVVAVLVFSEHLSAVSQRHSLAEARNDALAERLRAKAPRRSTAAPDPQILANVERANRIIDQLTVPWAELFDAVESADARGLAVLSLTPNAVDRSLRLTGEARAMGELLAYVARVANQPALTQVHLLSYKTQLRDGVPVVSFNLAATWRQQP